MTLMMPGISEFPWRKMMEKSRHSLGYVKEKL
jgi:hypothetical protein